MASNSLLAVSLIGELHGYFVDNIISRGHRKYLNLHVDQAYVGIIPTGYRYALFKHSKGSNTAIVL